MLSLCHIKPVSFAVFVEDDSRCREVVFQFVKRHLFGKASGYAAFTQSEDFRALPANFSSSILRFFSCVRLFKCRSDFMGSWSV